MAILVNKSQQVVTEGFAPKTAYSRIITVHASCAGGGNYAYGVSPVLGQRLWLLSINVTVQADLGGQFQRMHFSIHRGKTAAQRWQDVREWEHLIDFGTFAGFHGMVVYGQWKQFRWNVSKLFTGELNRLGVLFYNAGDSIGVCHVFFSVAEG